MAALLKKRALAEFSQVVQEEVKPLKRLRLVPKSPGPEVQLNLQDASTSQETLHLLLKFEESLPIDGCNVGPVLRQMTDHFQREKEAMVRCKVASLIQQLAKIPGFSHDIAVDDVLSLLKSEKSSRVLSGLIDGLYVIGKTAPSNTQLQEHLVNTAIQNLTSASHLVRSSCLNLIGSLSTLEKTDGDNRLLVQKILADYMEDQDPRVRSSAFQAVLTLHQRGIQVDLSMYEHTCKALKDDYEGVRLAAVKLVWVLSHLYPESTVPVLDSGEELQLVNHSFIQICNMVNDLSMKVRTETTKLLGSLHLVSPKFLEQTLDKKLMSNMRRKTSAHERAREHYRSGEWSTGQKWADDAPKEEVDPENMSLMSSGACGAFVHGLEDEYLEVRNAALDSLCELACQSPNFAKLSQDSMIDMFNDEIESVRLNAINSLRKISIHLVLREDQMEIILCVLQDFSFTIRDALRDMLCNVRLATKECLNSCVVALLDNLKRYPQDRSSIWKCMKHLGSNLSTLTLPLVPELLCIQPYFVTPEPDMDDPAYISILVLVFNAAVTSPTMLPMFQEHTWRHYTYLRDSIPDLVPYLQVPGAKPICGDNTVQLESGADLETFFQQSSSRLGNLEQLKGPVAEHLLEITVRDLERVAKLDSRFSASVECACIFLKSQLMLTKVVSQTSGFLNGFISSENISSLLDKIQSLTTKLQCLFLGLTNNELAMVHQTDIKVLAIQLKTMLGQSRSSSAVRACGLFIVRLKDLQRYLMSNDIQPDSFVSQLLAGLDSVSPSRPSSLSKLIQSTMHLIKPCAFLASHKIRKAAAIVHEPAPASDSPLKFTAGLTASVTLIAMLENIENTKDIRVKLKYPDLQTQLIQPKQKDFQKLGPLHHRLVTNVILSHWLWSDPCHVELSVAHSVKPGHCLDELSTDTCRQQVVELCKPVMILVATKPVKRA